MECFSQFKILTKKLVEIFQKNEELLTFGFKKKTKTIFFLNEFENKQVKKIEEYWRSLSEYSRIDKQKLLKQNLNYVFSIKIY